MRSFEITTVVTIEKESGNPSYGWDKGWCHVDFGSKPSVFKTVLSTQLMEVLIRHVNSIITEHLQVQEEAKVCLQLIR